MLGTDELNAYLNKYRLELDPQLDALVGRYVVTTFLSGDCLFLAADSII